MKKHGELKMFKKSKNQNHTPKTDEKNTKFDDNWTEEFEFHQYKSLISTNSSILINSSI